MPCHVDAIEKPVDERALRESAEAVLNVRGMGCANCVIRVRNALLRLPGVLAAQVHLDGQAYGHARVHFDPERTRLQDLLDAVAGAGEGSHHTYRATGVENPGTGEP